MHGLLRARVGVDGFTAAVLLAAAIYVGLAWSPSSYGEALSQMGVPGEGLVLGQPRDVRFDEWAVWTPLFQAAINNDFQRYNETSVYREDLRNFNGLPLADWSLAFKPYLWPFFFLPPGHAFSFYHAFWMALFLLGYPLLLTRLSIPRAPAVLATLALFFTSFGQTWWTTTGPVTAGFPWMLILATSSLRPLPKGLWVAYATAAWLLAHLYPPMLITLAFVAGCVLVAFPPRLPLRHWIACAAGAGLGILVAAFYLRDVIPAVAGTVFPGGRVTAGGVGASPLQWLAQFFPFLVTSGYRPLVSWNVCEASTVGTWIPLLALAFIDPSAFRRRWVGSAEADRQLRRQLVVLALGFALTSLWILAPLPSSTGWPFLWNRVPANRMWFACGFLLLLLCLRILTAATLRPTWPRALGVGLVVLATWLASEHGLAAGPLPARYTEFVLLLPLGLVLALRARLDGRMAAALVGCAALANGVAFGGFNPIQSATPIFERPATPVSERLDRLARAHPRGWLVIDGASGAWLNGWGYRSVPHTLLTPRSEFLSAQFPELSPARLEHLFNRTGTIMLTPTPLPYLSGNDLLGLPLEAFEPRRIPVEIEPLDDEKRETRGFLTPGALFRMDQTGLIVLRGWAALDTEQPSALLRVQTDLPLRSAVAYPSLPTPFRATAGALQGFAVALTGDVTLATRKGDGVVRVISVDPKRGTFEIPPDSTR